MDICLQAIVGLFLFYNPHTSVTFHHLLVLGLLGLPSLSAQAFQ